MSSYPCAKIHPLWGGIIIQVGGDKRIDGSVARRLEELEKSLLRTNSIR
ncbi:F0F1 ATP synthase subunit delta [Veillonella rogosae]|nr:F0F1 ATP synthase subunit delta [Veillonella rogosae]